MKAVIMAGGEGSRLRPLTSNIPKPMARLCGKPILEYIMDLLIKNGVDYAGLSLGYLPNVIKKHFEYKQYKTLKIDFFEEDEPLGTAGGVKNVAENFKEPFIVISGDAMCDYELDKIVKYHNASGAMATIVCTRVNDPREYGLVNIDTSGRVLGFLEKPGWGQVVTDLANTGIYILDPKCLELVEKNKKVDFAKDLFPEMLEENIPIYAYVAEGYWCDIGNLESYLKCQKDMLSGSVDCDFPNKKDGITYKDKMPKGKYNIIPPVYIGENVEIADGATIGPYSVIDDNCLISKRASIKESVMLENSSVGLNVSMRKAILCSGASLKKNVSMFEGSAVGSKSVIGENSTVNGNVLIWPNKIIEKSKKINSNIKSESNKQELFDDEGIKGEKDIDLTPEIAAKLGEAIGSINIGKKVGIASDESVSAKGLKLAMIAGMMSVGSHVWDFGECFEAQLSFFTSFCGLGVGIFISYNEELNIKICAEGGLPLPRFIEREIESRMDKCEFNRCSEEKCKNIADMSSIKVMYRQELCRQAPYGLSNFKIQVESENENIKDLFNECIKRLDADVGRKYKIIIDKQGVKANIITDEIEISNEKMLAICCNNELKNGNTISLPYDAPHYIDDIAKIRGGKVLRYLHCPTNEADLEARRITAKQFWVRDGLFLAIRTLSIVNESEKTLKELADELPKIEVMKKEFEINVNPSVLSEIFGESSEIIDNPKEGIILNREKGRLLITPTHTGKSIKVLAEAANMEIAEELCDEVKNMINN